MNSKWEMVRLEEIAYIKQGKKVPHFPSQEAKFPVLGATGVVGSWSEASYYEPRVALGCRGTVGKTRLVQNPSWFGNNVMAIWPKDTGRTMIGYLEHAIAWTDLEIQGAIGGQVQKQITRVGLSNVKIALPPLDEQRRISDLIGALDDAIEAAEQHTLASRLILECRRNELLQNNDSNQVVAGDVFEITMGRQRSPKHEQGDGMRPYLRSANVTPGQLMLEDVKIMNFSEKEVVKFKLLPGDVLVTEGSGSPETVGAAARWSHEIPSPVCFQNTLLRYRAIEGVTTPGFVYHWCQWAFESGKFLNIASGTNIKHIGSTRAIKVPVQMHDLKRQHEICDELTAHEDVLNSSISTASSLRNLRSELLTALLSGAHEIPESYDEVIHAT